MKGACFRVRSKYWTAVWQPVLPRQRSARYSLNRTRSSTHTGRFEGSFPAVAHI